MVACTGPIISHNIVKDLREDRKGDKGAMSYSLSVLSPSVSPYLLPIMPSKMACTLSILADDQSD